MTVIKLIAIAKNESTSLASWIFHHLRIGVDFIEIYINNSDDNSLEICRLISTFEPRFSYFEADAFMDACIKNSENFQLAAYNRSVKFSQTIQDGITHFLLLDLDEYLTPASLKSNLKELIKCNPSIDIFSFLWYSDDYKSKQQAFSKAYEKNIDIYMMDHVKSMARSDIILGCIHHNFITNKKDEHLMNLLVGTKDIFLDDNINTELRRSKLIKSFHSRAKSIKPIEWFVHHRIHLSPTEYLASLLRGRSHNNDPSPIKKNRWGRTPYPAMPSEPYQISFDDFVLDTYYKDLDLFLDHCKIKTELTKSKAMLISRAQHVLNLIKKDPKILGQYPGSFRGLNFEEIEKELADSSD